MARGKKWISTRTPTEHRLYVEELDRMQRVRSANGKSQKSLGLPAKPNKTPHSVNSSVTRAKLYAVERYTQE